MENNMRQGKIFSLSFTVAALILFVLFFPVLNGLPIDDVLGSKLLGWLPSWPTPIKGILKFILHAAVGLLILIAVNVIGGFFDFYIPLTWISVILAGVGGIPGVILLILIHLLF